MPLNIETVTNRPTALQALIDKNFAENATLDEKNPTAPNQGTYIQFGRTQYYYFCSSDIYTSTQFILAMNKIKPNFDLLDIGTGNGELIRYVNHRFPLSNTIGITAKDMRKNFDIENNRYIVGNAENLIMHSIIQPPRKFDCIFSSNTFMHFVDPLGALIQAYELLKDNGILMIDEFSLPGLNPYITEKLASYLRNQGYEVDAGSNCDLGVRHFFIRKINTQPHLNLPINYNIKNGKFSYSEDEKLLEYDATKEIGYKYDHFKSSFAVFNKVDSFDEFNKIDQILSQVIILITKLVEIKCTALANGIKDDFPLFKDINILQQFLILNNEQQKEFIRVMVYKNPYYSQLSFSTNDVQINTGFIISIADELKAKTSTHFYSQQSNQTLFPPNNSQTQSEYTNTALVTASIRAQYKP